MRSLCQVKHRIGSTIFQDNNQEFVFSFLLPPAQWSSLYKDSLSCYICVVCNDVCIVSCVSRLGQKLLIVIMKRYKKTQLKEKCKICTSTITKLCETYFWSSLHDDGLSQKCVFVFRKRKSDHRQPYVVHFPRRKETPHFFTHDMKTL